MDIQSEISWIQNELLKLKDPEVIQALKNILKSNKTEASELDQAYDRALLDKNEGRVKSHSEIKKKYEKGL